MLHAYVVWKMKGLCNVQALIRFHGYMKSTLLQQSMPCNLTSDQWGGRGCICNQSSAM